MNDPLFFLFSDEEIRDFLFLRRNNFNVSISH